MHTVAFLASESGVAEPRLTLENLMPTHPTASYFFRVEGSSEWMSDGDLLVVDRSLVPRPGDWVVLADGSLRLHRLDGNGRLPAEPTSQLWGVVRWLVRRIRR